MHQKTNIITNYEQQIKDNVNNNSNKKDFQKKDKDK